MRDAGDGGHCRGIQTPPPKLGALASGSTGMLGGTDAGTVAGGTVGVGTGGVSQSHSGGSVTGLAGRVFSLVGGFGAGVVTTWVVVVTTGAAGA
ncbi:hypothetical protein, partial [Actinoplanes philippinensis]|uniref:hypothetical protein n=1 Tax=Actinoplanes philippinensis TaxID=35752 RepID=UPI0033F286DF